MSVVASAIAPTSAPISLKQFNTLMEILIADRTRVIAKLNALYAKQTAHYSSEIPCHSHCAICGEINEMIELYQTSDEKTQACMLKIEEQYPQYMQY